MEDKRLVIVLGKRLFKNALTPEGVSRVDALVEAMASGKIEPESRIAFCGGITQGQTRSEAIAMFDYFQQRCHANNLAFSAQNILLEERSTSTVENIFEVSRLLNQSGQCSAGSVLKVTFVSNDYHLKRIFEIQQLMDEQGLLRVLRERCAQHGVHLDIHHDLEAHVSVPYPNVGGEAQLFLLIDELTTYRVYLEGVARGVFQRPLKEVRRIPYQKAQDALSAIRSVLSQNTDWSPYYHDFAQLQQWIEESDIEQEAATISQIARCFNRTLVGLNRRFDPEQALRD
ncbi:YdcF family protein [Vibrio vulnificus]|uniref:YdcF family protein n=1 Tax=Vibrio vulnificus TaxID=672 RepID=UPI000D3E23E3|nr:YdcF family protein [Vibrio vulnificus]ELV8619724.1 YdcF family protein [Vibrio vulnificus]ELV8735130.1 YdcF family protein [Vibrio vulnificus]MCJ0814404.1 YdcF family protein [Vibrio vulnificus]MCR9705355.1 YdcF family protein [Vibrio vulnificus]MDT8802433.1 YdcF family protein [Vibrio vulnificus]